MTNGRKFLKRLIRYIKEDRPDRFKTYSEKNVNCALGELFSGAKKKTLLHYTAKHGSGSLISYLLERNVSPSKADKNGNLPFHVALSRALSQPPTKAREVYFDVVVPLKEAYPLALDIDDEAGRSGLDLLTALKRHLASGGDRYQRETREFQESYEEEWAEKLAQEFESEASELFGRYTHEEDVPQVTEQENYDEWANRMWREYKQLEEDNNKNCSGSDKTRSKHQHREKDDATAGPHRKRKIIDEEALKRERRKMQKQYRHAKDIGRKLALKKTYEEKYHKVLEDKSGKKLGFQDIPWPCEGGIHDIVNMLFCDLPDALDASQRKYLKEQKVRWHPDKFMQRFSDRLAPESAKEVLERVKEISQAVNNRVEAIISKTEK